MPRRVEAEARRPNPVVRRRAYQESFREDGGDSAQTEINILGICSKERLPRKVMFGEIVGGKG